MKRPAPHGSVSITDGTIHIGTVITNDRGHDAYDRYGKYLATYPNQPAARKAVCERYRSTTRASSTINEGPSNE